jgi:hypothetical protein
VHLTAAEQHNGITIHNPPVLVAEEGAIGISVEGDAQRNATILLHLCGNYIGVQCTAMLVNIAPVGLVRQEHRGYPGGSEHLVGNRGSGAVGAIHDGADMREVNALNLPIKPLHVFASKRMIVVQRHLGRFQIFCFKVAENVALDIEFHFVRKLVAVVAEDLDAVVLPRIM